MMKILVFKTRFTNKRSEIRFNMHYWNNKDNVTILKQQNKLKFVCFDFDTQIQILWIFLT